MAENEFACLTYHLVGPWPTQYAVCEEDLRAHLSLFKSDGHITHLACRDMRSEIIYHLSFIQGARIHAEGRIDRRPDIIAADRRCH